ncbi:hypothetical protein TI39_contig1021g00008 [Zymoseptoria brevis]|uniref:Uncharacterized protein n=1 Tax=Zymoseptoria brevis TaxID=1047168 RepID=A0A0F4GFP3_9PEZI|nr:hypothetical protein TI39_contig1021g00008 [Zymoseptoria brevis]
MATHQSGGGSSMTLPKRSTRSSISAHQDEERSSHAPLTSRVPHGKISRLAPRAIPGGETLSTTLPVEANILASAQDSQKIVLNETQCTLITKVESRLDSRYDCNTIVLAYFFLLPYDHQGEVPDDAEAVGSLGANIVDKKMQREQDSLPFYIPELLAIPKRVDRPLSHPHEKSRLSELQTTLKHILEKTGEPRQEYTAHHAALTTDKIHLVVEFSCAREY